MSTAARAKTAIESAVFARRAWASQPAPAPAISATRSAAAGPLPHAAAQPRGGRRVDGAVIEAEDQLILRPPASQASASLGIIGKPVFDRADTVGGQVPVGISVQLRLVGQAGRGGHLTLLINGSALAGP